jgi:hypothetical protein
VIFGTNKFQKSTGKLATMEMTEYRKSGFGQRNLGIGKLSKRIRKSKK